MTASYARDALAGGDAVLRTAARALRGIGRVVQVLGVLGLLGVGLLTLALYDGVGAPGLLALVLGVFPWRALVVGRHGVKGGALLSDPRRVQELLRHTSGTGRQWIQQVGELRTGAPGQRGAGKAARIVLQSGRSLWTALGPSVDGATSLRELAIWPKTIAGLVAAPVCVVLFVLGLVAGLVSLLA